MSVSEIIATYQELGIGGILIVVVIIIGRHLMRQNKACYDSYQDHVTAHKDEIKDLSMTVLKVVEENTQSNTALTKTIEHLDSRMRGCAFNDNGRATQR